MSEESQDQRDELADWFVDYGVMEEDVDSVYIRRNDDKFYYNQRATHMVFAFRDPRKATLFKLSFA